MNVIFAPSRHRTARGKRHNGGAELSEVQLGHLIYLWRCLFSAEHRRCPADFYHCAVTHRRPPLISALFCSGWGKLYKRTPLLTIDSNRLHDLDEGVKSSRLVILERRKNKTAAAKSNSDGPWRARTSRRGYPLLIAVYETTKSGARRLEEVLEAGESSGAETGSPRRRRNPFKL